MKFFLLIPSCHSGYDRRQGCRDTWVPRLLSNMTLRFFLGQPPVDIYPCASEPDTVELPVPDGWDDLWRKVRLAFRYSLQFDYDYAFKLDDDTYLVPERLENAIQEIEPGKLAEMIGGTTCQVDHYCVGGAGYLVSRNLAEKIANGPEACEKNMGEDCYVGWVARSHVKFLWDDRFQFYKDLFPTQANDIITCHHLKSSAMMHEWHLRYMYSEPTKSL